MPDKFENGTLPMKTKQKFSVHTWKRIKCSASGAHMSFCLRPHYKDQRRQKRLNAPLSMPISRYWARREVGFQPTSPYSRHIWTLLFTRKRLLSFLIYLPCQALRIILRKKKTKPNTFHGLMTRWNCCWMSQATTKLRRPLISLIHVIKCDI